MATRVYDGKTYNIVDYGAPKNADGTPSTVAAPTARSMTPGTASNISRESDISDRKLREGMAAGRERASELYGMESSEIGEETQDIISRYKAKLDDTTQSKQAANVARRDARAEKGQSLTTGESAQLSRSAETAQQAESAENLAAYKSLMGNIAANTGSLEMGYGNIGVAGQAPATTISSGSTVICTELMRQGKLPRGTWEADLLYGNNLMLSSPVTYHGYYVWAKHVARWMRKSKLITNIIAPFGIAWANNIAGKKNFLGYIIEKIGLPLCWTIGKLTLKREKIHG